MNVASSCIGGSIVIALSCPVLIAVGPADVVNAARDHDVVRLRTLLEHRADVNMAQGDGATALHWAAHWDDLQLARLLIGAGARVDAADDHGVTPLSLACLNASTTMVKLLLDSGANPNTVTVVGETPLMVAAHTGNVETVRMLLNHGADVSARETAAGQTPLMRAVAENHPAVVELLLEGGADARARSINRFTPLLFAAQQGNVEIARLLLDWGGDVAEAAPDGIGGDTNALKPFRPGTEAATLLVAIDSGHEDMALFLLNRGADPNHHGAGRSALHSAVQQHMPKLVKALLEHGADPNARLDKPLPLLSRIVGQQTGLEVDTIGATPFWLAASFGDVETMRLLVAGHADPNVTTVDDTTPLMAAAGVDFTEGQDKYGRRWFSLDTSALQEAAMAAVLYCLELGANINAANSRGQTALHGAVYFGGTTMVPFMVEHGANVNVVNKRGQTPWLITQGEYQAGSFIAHKETGEVLERYGADTRLGRDLWEPATDIGPAK